MTAEVWEFVTPKPAEFYAKGIDDKKTSTINDKWQRTIANDGECIVDQDIIVIRFIDG